MRYACVCLALIIICFPLMAEDNPVVKREPIVTQGPGEQPESEAKLVEHQLTPEQKIRSRITTRKQYDKYRADIIKRDLKKYEGKTPEQIQAMVKKGMSDPEQEALLIALREARRIKYADGIKKQLEREGDTIRGLNVIHELLIVCQGNPITPADARRLKHYLNLSFSNYDALVLLSTLRKMKKLDWPTKGNIKRIEAHLLHDHWQHTQLYNANVRARIEPPVDLNIDVEKKLKPPEKKQAPEPPKEKEDF